MKIFLWIKGKIKFSKHGLSLLLSLLCWYWVLWWWMVSAASSSAVLWPCRMADLSGSIKTLLTSPCTHGKHWATLRSNAERQTDTNAHTQGHTHKNKEKKVNGTSRWLVTPGSQITGTNFPKQHFQFSFSFLWLLRCLETCHVFPLDYRVTVDQ